MDSCLRRNDGVEDGNGGVGWHEGYFQRNPPCRLVACTPRDENALTHRTGNHKGCPYGRLAGVIFVPMRWFYRFLRE